MFWIIALLALQWGLEPMSNGEIKTPTNVIPKIRAAEKQEMEWINNFYDQVEFIHSHFESEVIAIAEFNGGKAGLVDDITISIIAMVLGSGIPLFSVMNQEHKCLLVSTQSYPSGLVQLKYEVIRDKLK